MRVVHDFNGLVWLEILAVHLSLRFTESTAIIGTWFWLATLSVTLHFFSPYPTYLPLSAADDASITIGLQEYLLQHNYEVAFPDIALIAISMILCIAFVFKRKKPLRLLSLVIALTEYCISSFSVIPKGYKVSKIPLPVNPTIGLRLEGRSLSNSLRPNSPISGKMKDNKLKGPLNKGPDAENCVVQGDVYADEIDSFKDEREKIDVMTVQELRTKLRSVGIPAKGRKQDLVSALKCYMEKKIVHGDGSISEEQTFIFSSQRTSNDANPDEDVSELSGHQQRKRGSKESGVDSETIDIKNKIPRTKRKMSAKSDKASGAKLSVSNVEVSSDVIRTDGVDVSITQSEPWTILAHKKPQKDWIPYNPRTLRLSPLTRDSNFVKIVSWNVNGLRALLKLEGFSALQLAQREDFDILCLQETKLQEKDVENIKNCLIEGYDNSYWTCSVSKLGYSGTAIISRIKPLSVRYGLGNSDHDSEGRLVTAEFDSFYLLSGYVPNSGDGLKRLSYRITEWDPSLSNYMKELEKSKPVILTGDLNCAHQEIDIYNPAGNKRSAGFTDEERQSFGMNFLSRGFVDTFRRQHPNVVGYTYWGYRHGGRRTNKGWRLDYFLVSESVFDKVHDSYILPDVTGSDHCPIGLIYKL